MARRVGIRSFASPWVKGQAESEGLGWLPQDISGAFHGPGWHGYLVVLAL